MVDVLIAYAAGTERLMRACLDSLARHEAGVDYAVTVVTDQRTADEAVTLFGSDVERLVSYAVSDYAVGSQRHAFVLDEYMKGASGLVLTMDSDVLPVADGWLGELCSMVSAETMLPGIRWPWEPPGSDVTGIEARVRSNQNWNNTWVACQLVEPEWVRAMSLKYASGDDTGFALAAQVREMGLRMPGWLPTRCALPEGGMDPELNRMMCVAYGDKVVHIGGGSGKATGRVVDADGAYDKAVERVLSEGADWILNDDESHLYEFTREDEVVEYKMRGMYNEMKRYLQTHDSLFDK